MKVFVKDEKCIGCGSCVSVTDEKIFDFNDEGKAYAKVENVSDEDIMLVKTAMDYCPTDAIYEQTRDEDTNEDNSNKKNTNMEVYKEEKDVI